MLPKQRGTVTGSRTRVGRMQAGGIRLSGLCSVIHNARPIPTVIASQTMPFVILSRSPERSEGAAKNLETKRRRSNLTFSPPARSEMYYCPDKSGRPPAPPLCESPTYRTIISGHLFFSSLYLSERDHFSVRRGSVNETVPVL